MTKLIIHIGTQKTGTSVLQEFMSVNRAALATQKIQYPLWGRGPKGKAAEHAHHILAHHWAPGWLSQQIKNGGTDKAWANFCEVTAKADGGTFVVSSEHFYKAMILNPKAAQGIRDALPDVDVTIISYFRQPDEFALSNWAHNIKTIREFRQSFPEYCQSQSLTELLSYKRNMDVWCAAFGEENVITRVYDRQYFVNGDIIDDFFSLIGAERNGKMRDVGEVNVSLSPFTLDFLHGLDRDAIPRYQQLVERLETYAATVVTKDQHRTFSPITDDLANDLLDRFGEDFHQMSLQTVEGGIDVESLRPTGGGHVYSPVPQETINFALALWGVGELSDVTGKKA